MEAGRLTVSSPVGMMMVGVGGVMVMGDEVGLGLLLLLLLFAPRGREKAKLLEVCKLRLLLGGSGGMLLMMMGLLELKLCMCC